MTCLPSSRLTLTVHTTTRAEWPSQLESPTSALLISRIEPVPSSFLQSYHHACTSTYASAPIAMSSPDPSYLDHLSAADIYRDVIFRERIRTTGQEWIVLNDSYAHLNLPQIEIYAQGIRLGGGQGPPAFSWLPPLAGWGLYFKRRVFHYRNGGGPVSGRQTSHRAELMVSA